MLYVHYTLYTFLTKKLIKLVLKVNKYYEFVLYTCIKFIAKGSNINTSFCEISLLQYMKIFTIVCYMSITNDELTLKKTLIKITLC